MSQQRWSLYSSGYCTKNSRESLAFSEGPFKEKFRFVRCEWTLSHCFSFSPRSKPWRINKLQYSNWWLARAQTKIVTHCQWHGTVFISFRPFYNYLKPFSFMVRIDLKVWCLATSIWWNLRDHDFWLLPNSEPYHTIEEISDQCFSLSYGFNSSCFYDKTMMNFTFFRPMLHFACCVFCGTDCIWDYW